MLQFQSHPRQLPQRSGASGVWALARQRELRAGAMEQESRRATAYEASGAVYAYVKSHEKRSADGVTVVPQYWQPMELAKIQAPDAAARDAFGSAMALSGHSVALGAPGQDGLVHDAGAAYVYSLEFASLTFSAVRRKNYDIPCSINWLFCLCIAVLFFVLHVYYACVSGTVLWFISLVLTPYLIHKHLIIIFYIFVFRLNFPSWRALLRW
jgi:hypothetical protein